MAFSNQIDYWNSVSQDREFTTYLDHELVAKYLNPDSLIVDYGCGYGRTLNEFYALGYRNLIGFDYAAEMIKRGNVNYPHLDLRTCINDKISCPSNSVDMVILFAVLTCIKENCKQEELIAEIWRVLKPGGLIYINDFLVNTDERNMNRYDEFAAKYGTYGIFELNDGAVLRHHERTYISELTDGFNEKLFRKVTFKTMNGNTSNGFIFIGQKKEN
ncbi:class I SAM-dependent methyltransferase [Saccharicrinis sp. FJH2]|uniref:class I SAM-dependent methyltransferase n=1 Tax=Saccharicrinis sp. FJH65 TaxID=3344659 RepID=UPI0035F252EC